MFSLNEPSLKALHSRLVNDINGAVDEVNTALNDPLYPLEYPQQVLDYIPPTSHMSVFPTIAIGDGSIDFRDDTGWSATGHMDFVVVTWIQEFDQRALAWKLRRMMVAVSNVVLEGRSLAAEGGGWGVVLGKIEPGPTLGRKENPREVIGMRALTLSVRDEQDA